ncbi:hypothetical protein BJY04DRAFT_22857 [Aspergillus karnatakaensis]|uniref:uncharacterized protein n=1 Tax=Aspergillus karnatakaensis TaxID=1810916 RepID=UPI003CCD4EBA
MEPGRDFRSIINSVPFTFLVGPNHTKLTVQSGLARHVSRPLDHLMNSGQTRESKHQIAILEDEDVETFVAFCEYAYTGDYGVPPPGSREDDRDQYSINAPFRGAFPEDTAAPVPVADLQQSPRKSIEASNDAHAKVVNDDGPTHDGNDRDERKEEAASQQSHQEDEQAQYISATEYPPDDPTVTPGESDQSPASSADPSPSRGRRRRRGKAEKQGFNQDPASKLTPPCTPPAAARVEPAEHSAAGSAANPHALTEADQSPEQLVDHPAPSVGNGGTASPGGERDGLRQEGTSSRSRARPVIDTSFANQQFSPRHEKGTSLWDEFTGIEDTDFRSFHIARPSHPHPAFELPYLIFHAKLYTFATRYLIPDLAHLCLRKLHHDLLNLAFPDPDPENQYAEQFVLTTTKAHMVVDLLSYTYSKTTRLEPITSSSATQLRDNELRRLVVHYAACKVRDLAEYCPPSEPIVGSSFYFEKPSARGFRALLDTLPELASDLIYRMI